MSLTNRKSTVALLACTALVVTALGDFSGPSGKGPSLVSAAYAKSDNAGGNGNGNDNGNGNGNGNAGGNGNGNSGGNGNGNGNGNSGKSQTASTAASGKSGGNNNAGGLGNLLRGVFGKPAKSSTTTLATTTNGNGNGSGKAKKSQIQTLQLASLPVPSARSNALKANGNLNAKLAGLNSLNRNFHAYLNSKDPRMAAIREYVMASVDLANATDALAAAEEKLTAAEAAFAAALPTAFGGVTPYESSTVGTFDYTTADLQGLTDRKSALETELATLNLDPVTNADAISAIGTEIAAIDSFMGSQEVADLQTAETDVGTLQDTVDTLTAQTGDDALREALLAAANDNRVAQYGDGYIDDDIMAWAKEVLGVDGEAEVYGKIDEIRAYLAAQEAAAATTTDDASGDDSAI